MSVYMKSVVNDKNVGRDITLFCRRPLARCCASRLRILLHLRLSVDSVCINKLEVLRIKESVNEFHS